MKFTVDFDMAHEDSPVKKQIPDVPIECRYGFAQCFIRLQLRLVPPLMELSV